MQFVVQLPQAVRLVRRFVSQPLGMPPTQSPKPGSQLEYPHIDMEQVSTALRTVLAQLVPHPPQLLTALRTSVQVLPQHSLPVPLHASPAPVTPRAPPQVHCPELHVSLAPHTLPHAPQFVVLFATLTHVVPQQSGVPPTHASPEPTAPRAPPQVHRPAAQVSPGPQRLPQAPQLAASLWRSVHALPQQSGVAPVHASPLGADAPAPHWQSPAALQPSFEPQRVPQAPQLAVLNPVSQPFTRFMSQLRKPMSHDM